jgi:glucosamine-6-phosphate deaminase
MSRLDAGGGLRMVLPTGATPRPVYRELAARAPDLGDSEVFILDEFLGLPPGHPARCDTMIQQDLIALLDRPPPVNALDPDADALDAEAARYESLVGASTIDLTLLGLGLNGHIALNEPGSTPDDRSRVVDLHSTTMNAMASAADPPPTRGVTLGLANILASDEVWLLVNGGSKAEVLARAVEGPIGPDVPATYLRTHPNAVVFADEPAATELSG